MEDIVSAMVHDSRRGSGGGGSWHILVNDVVEYFVEAGKSSLGPREGGVVSTGRSAGTPRFLGRRGCCYYARLADVNGRARVQSWNGGRRYLGVDGLERKVVGSGI